MNNAKGFTLIEIIGVIGILLAISLIAIPSIVSISNKNNEKNYQEILETMYNSAEIYVEKNRNALTWTSNCIDVYLKTLVSEKLLKAPIINPKDETEFDLNNTYIQVCKESDNTLTYELK